MPKRTDTRRIPSRRGHSPLPDDPVPTKVGLDGCRGPKTFTYTYETLGQLLGVSPRTAKDFAYSGRFDPSDLRSVCELYAERKGYLERIDELKRRLKAATSKPEILGDFALPLGEGSDYIR